MLQRDYIQRLIREFMAALERMLEKKEVKVRREKIRGLYNQLAMIHIRRCGRYTLGKKRRESEH